MIPVNGDESVDLENTRKPPGRHSCTLKQFCKVHVVRHSSIDFGIYLHTFFIRYLPSRYKVHKIYGQTLITKNWKMGRTNFFFGIYLHDKNRSKAL